mmetsp:Transcript_40505/g.47408  ORF Transcript_40505/g.47408 Transcript_40505/m.47408 type:complete len:230 (+) Transcript_40505:186-875(+)
MFLYFSKFRDKFVQSSNFSSQSLRPIQVRHGSFLKFPKQSEEQDLTAHSIGRRKQSRQRSVESYADRSSIHFFNTSVSVLLMGVGSAPLITNVSLGSNTLHFSAYIGNSSSPLSSHHDRSPILSSKQVMLEVGERVGLALGIKVGATLGDQVGSELGLGLGIKVGISLGLSDGMRLGSIEGSSTSAIYTAAQSSNSCVHPLRAMQLLQALLLKPKMQFPKHSVVAHCMG